MRDKVFAIYIMANQRPTLYIGMTDDIVRIVYEHKTKFNPKSFTARYDLTKLVYYEVFDNSLLAIIREKQIKNMGRKEKLELIKSLNLEMKDLTSGITGEVFEINKPN